MGACLTGLRDHAGTGNYRRACRYSVLEPRYGLPRLPSIVVILEVVMEKPELPKAARRCPSTSPIERGPDGLSTGVEGVTENVHVWLCSWCLIACARTSVFQCSSVELPECCSITTDVRSIVRALGWSGQTRQAWHSVVPSRLPPQRCPCLSSALVLHTYSSTYERLALPGV